MENVKRILLGVLFMSIVSMVCFGCFTFKSTSKLTQVQKVEYTTMRTLEAARDFRVFALETSGTLYKSGLMDDDTKIRIIKAGDNLQNYINTASDALLIFHTTNGDYGTAEIDASLAAYQAAFNSFLEIVTPYLLNKGIVQTGGK